MRKGEEILLSSPHMGKNSGFKNRISWHDTKETKGFVSECVGGAKIPEQLHRPVSGRHVSVVFAGVFGDVDTN